MKKIYAGMAVLAFGAVAATSASADGMRRGSVKDAPMPVAPQCGTSVYNWNGVYAGVQVGTASYRTTLQNENGAAPFPLGFFGATIDGTREDEGFTVGGVIGYNMQKCNTVFGIEAEFNWVDVERSYGVSLGAPFGQVFNARSEMDFYGAIKLRTGFAFDNLLLYATGGFAWANIEHKGSNPALFGGAIPAGIASFSNSDTRWGWVVGVGTEYALTNRITWRSEATYTRFEDQDFNLNFSGPLAGLAPLRYNVQDEVWMIRTGLNFKFGG